MTLPFYNIRRNIKQLKKNLHYKYNLNMLRNFLCYIECVRPKVNVYCCNIDKLGSGENEK